MRSGVALALTLFSCGSTAATTTAAPEGGAVSPSCLGPKPTVIATVTGTTLGDLKADATAAYFTDASGSTPGRISKVALCGGAVTVLGIANVAVHSCGAAAQTSVKLALGDSQVYFLGGQTLGAIPKGGGQSTSLAFAQCGFFPSGMALEGGFIYLMQNPGSTNASVGQVDRISVTGGPMTPIATQLAISATAAADSNSYYWAGIDGSINRLSLAGGSVTVLARDAQGRPTNGLTVDSKYVYWSTSSRCNQAIGAPPCPPPSATAATISRVPIAGGAVQVVATDWDAAGIAVDASNVYWIDPNDSVKWAKLPGSGATGTNTLVANEPAYLGPVLGAGAVYWVAASGAVTSQVKGIAKP